MSGAFKSLLLVERFTLESLSKGEKKFSDLREDLGLSDGILKSILSEMLSKNWISYQRGFYSLNFSNQNFWANELTQKESLNLELKELFSSMVEMCQRQNAGVLKVQKVHLTDDEEKILNAHLANLENFFKGIKEQRRRKPMSNTFTQKEKVVVWAQGVYRDLIRSNLEAV